jgi:thymidine kinase
MFSGKSEEMIRRLRRAAIAGQRALIVKPLIDDRYDVGHVVSHAGAKMRAVTAQSSDEVLRLARGYDAIGIDEVQFFDDGITDAIDGLVSAGARVVAAGLAQDFRGRPFGAMPTLLCVAEFVDKLEAVCHRCGGPATMTQRRRRSARTFGGETVQVGAPTRTSALSRASSPAPTRCRLASTSRSPAELPGVRTLARARLRVREQLWPPSDARSTGSAVRTANWLPRRARGVSGSGAATPIGWPSCWCARRALPRRRAHLRPGLEEAICFGWIDGQVRARQRRTFSVSRQGRRGAAGRSGTRHSPSG